MSYLARKARFVDIPSIIIVVLAIVAPLGARMF